MGEVSAIRGDGGPCGWWGRGFGHWRNSCVKCCGRMVCDCLAAVLGSLSEVVHRSRQSVGLGSPPSPSPNPSPIARPRSDRDGETDSESDPMKPPTSRLSSTSGQPLSLRTTAATPTACPPVSGPRGQPQRSSEQDLVPRDIHDLRRFRSAPPAPAERFIDESRVLGGGVDRVRACRAVLRGSRLSVSYPAPTSEARNQAVPSGRAFDVGAGY